jgi:hypothetical protein
MIQTDELHPLVANRRKRISFFLKLALWKSICLAILVTEILLYHHCNDVHCTTNHSGALSIGQWMYLDIIFRCALNWSIFMLFVVFGCSPDVEPRLKLLLCENPFRQEREICRLTYDFIRWIYFIASPLWGIIGLIMRSYISDDPNDCKFDAPSLYYVQLVYFVLRILVIFP